MHELIPLTLLRAGQSAVVQHVVGGSDQVHRLHELGLRDGAELDVIQAGSPCIVRLAGQKLCIRAEELLHVLVRQLQPAGN